MKALFTAAAIALIAASSPVLAQSTTTQPNSATPQQDAPGQGGRSKVGVPGQPGNKSGPNANDGNASGQQGASAPEQTKPAGSDESKVPGLPGNKSGPSQKPSSK
jgi:hypothetical protein